MGVTFPKLFPGPPQGAGQEGEDRGQLFVNTLLLVIPSVKHIYFICNLRSFKKVHKNTS